MPQLPVPCPRCRHHFVTYDPQLPHGCRLFGIRTKQLPSVIVHQESGQPCAHYAEKPRPGDTAPPRA